VRVNVYAEEMTDRVEIISKEIDGRRFTGLRLYLELPATEIRNGETRQVAGPFMHHPGDDDSAAVTFWGKRDLRLVLKKMLAELDAHYAITQQFKHERRVVGHVSGWKEQMNTCVCGRDWPCDLALTQEGHQK
jgi:hypothetical protein